MNKEKDTPRTINVFRVSAEGRNEVVISDRPALGGLKPVLSGTDLAEIDTLLTVALQTPCTVVLDGSFAREEDTRLFGGSGSVMSVEIRDDPGKDMPLPGDTINGVPVRTYLSARRIFEILEARGSIFIRSEEATGTEPSTVAEALYQFIRETIGDKGNTIAILVGAAHYIIDTIDPETYRSMYEDSHRSDSPVFAIPIHPNKTRS